jgi:hypothetical protein
MIHVMTHVIKPYSFVRCPFVRYSFVRSQPLTLPPLSFSLATTGFIGKTLLLQIEGKTYDTAIPGSDCSPCDSAPDFP